MKIDLILAGKTKQGSISELAAEYEQRIKHYVPFSITITPDLKNTKNLSQEQIKQTEGELLLKNLKPQDTLILLDEGGKEFRSLDFAAWIEKHQHTTSRLVFTVGGPYGFSKAVYERANGKISLSKMTFSHQLIRPIFLEQLYRAFTIIKGEPYHHE